MESQHKITILNLIKDNKDILFGRFSPKLTHEDKVNKWKEITKELNSSKMFEKDWKYLRDTTWQNWKRRTMEKRDNRRQTGSGGGKRMKFDMTDDLILSIIGKDSPVIDGLDTVECSGTNVPLTTEPSRAETREECSQDLASQIYTPTPVRSSRKMPKSGTENEILNLKKEKLELEVGKLKRENYKLDLELLKLEKELNITRPSNFTLPLYLRDDTIISIDLLNTNNAVIVDNAENEVNETCLSESDSNN